jgi:hypothetical protein
MASPLTVYSGAADGWITSFNTAWATCRDAVTGTSVDHTTSNDYRACRVWKISDANFYINRVFYPFDVATAGLPAGCTITALTLNVRGDGAKTEQATVVESTQASATDLAVEDFDACGTTEFVTHLDTWADAYNTFTFNAAGLTYANANKAGWMKFCMREYSYDFLNSAPGDTNDHQVGACFSEMGGTGYDPYIVITYTLPSFIPGIMQTRIIPSFLGGL